MKKAIIGSKSRLYDFMWRVSNDKQSLNENLKQLKIAGDAFSLTVKGSFKKKNNYTTAGIASKEDKEDFKTEQSAGALVLSAFYKLMKKPETLNLSGHMIKENKDIEERPISNDDVTAKNWVLMFSAEDRESSENGYWVGIISNGEPWLVFFDRFVQENDAYSEQGTIIEELSSMIMATDDKANDFTFVSDRQDIIKRFEDLYYGHNSLVDKPFESIVISFDSLTENVKHPRLEKINTSVINPVYIGVAIALAGVGFGINYYMGYLQEQEALQQSIKNNQDAERTKTENLKMQAEYEKLKEKTLKDTLAEANKELNEKISVGNPDLTITSWLDNLYQIKLNENGWLLKEVNCSVANEKVNCNISLQKGKLAFNHDLMVSRPNIKINNDKAVYSIKGSDAIEYKKENYNTLPDSKVFLLDTITLLQKLELAGIKYSTGNLQEITKSVTLPEPPSKMISQNMNVDPIKMGVSAGSLKITGKGLYMLEGLRTWLSDPTLKVDTIKVVVGADGNVNWELNGNYFVKTADAPTLPKIEPSTIGVNIKK